MKRVHSYLVLAAAVALIAAPAVAANPESAAMKKLAGAWMIQTVVPPNPILGNTEDIVFPELVTFTTGGAVVMTTGLSIFALPIGGEEVPVLSPVGHANCKKIGRSRFATTQWRFVTSMADGGFVGFMKITTDFRLTSRQLASGSYRVEILNPDLTPYQVNGLDFVIDGSFQMTRLPVERLR